jgi:hypothetical protein
MMPRWLIRLTSLHLTPVIAISVSAAKNSNERTLVGKRDQSTTLDDSPRTRQEEGGQQRRQQQMHTADTDSCAVFVVC